MAAANTPAVHQALELIFNKPVLVHGTAVKVVLDTYVAADQLADLASLAEYLHNWPDIKRSGAGLTVQFPC